jgi:Na+/H+-dicarboxylate symporter
VLRSLVPVFEPIGQLWLNALLMIALPLVVSLLLVAIIGAGKSQQAGRLGGATLLWFTVLLVGTGLCTVVIGSALVQWFPIDSATRAAVQSSLGSATETAVKTTQPTGSLRDLLVNLVPNNLVAAFASGETLPVIVAALLIAMAVRGIPEERRLLLHKFFEAISETTLGLARYLLMLLPIAVFSLTFVASSKAGPSVAGGVAYYVVAVTALLIVAILLLYPVTWWLGRISPIRFGRAVFPCQVVAATTRSSLAALPSLLDRGQGAVGVPTPVATFVLPLAASVFKLNRTISSPLKVIVLGHLYGMHVDSALKLSFVLIATLLSFGTPGLPSGGRFVTLPFYLAAGLPIQAIVLIDAVDSIPDVFKTILNVTADMSVAVFVTRSLGLTLAPVPSAPEAVPERAR